MIRRPSCCRRRIRWNASVWESSAVWVHACYYEPAWDMIVNLEAGDYGGLVRNRWDKAVDA